MGTNSSSIQISLVGDFSGTVPTDGLLVETDADYVIAAQMIRDRAVEEKRTILWVRKKAHYSWLRAYAESVKLVADFDEKTPRLILADAWSVSIPDWLKDEQVLEQKLLDLQLPASHPADFTGALLAMFFGDPFSKGQISAQDIPELIKIASPDNKNLFQKYPVLHQCLEQKCMEWRKASNAPWTEDVLEILQKKPDSLWHDLTLWVVLCGYPKKILEYAIPPHRVALVQQLPPENLAGMEMNDAALEEAKTQVDLFFHDVGHQIKKAEDLPKIIESCSGKLRDEFVHLMKILQASQVPVQSVHLEKIREKFSSCPGVTTSDLTKLEKYVVPNAPKILDEGQDWDADQWRNWTAKEYIPYRLWLTENNQKNPDLEKTVGAFSDWYTKNYSSIHQDLNLSLVHVLNSWSDRMEQDDVSLVVVVDCLPLTYFPLVLKTFHLNGFFCHEQKTVFAPLPSNTQTCKSLLLSGDWQVAEKANYSGMVDERVAARWPEKNACYLPNLQVMASTDVTEQQSTVYVLNYTPSDEVMHSDPGLKGMTYEEELLNCFTKLAEAVKEFLDRIPNDIENTSIYMVTDHGAARILDVEMENLESAVVNDLFENSKHRFAMIHKEDANSIPANLWNMGYRFKKPLAECDFEYFIPHGHKTVGTKKKPAGHVHGGATPEEIIVPAAVFKTVERKWKAPQGRFSGVKFDALSKAAIFHIKRIVSIELNIQNPNPEPLRVVRFEIIKPETSEVREFSPGEIDGHKEKQFVIKCYFKQAATKENELLLRVIYHYGEEERELILPLKAMFKTAMTGGLSLKDL